MNAHAAGGRIRWRMTAASGVVAIERAKRDLTGDERAEALAERFPRNAVEVFSLLRRDPHKQPFKIEPLHHAARARAKSTIAVVERGNAGNRPFDKSEIANRHRVEKDLTTGGQFLLHGLPVRARA